MASSAQHSLQTIEAFLSRVGQIKTADGSEPESEAGSIGGETSHPVKNVDDRLQDAPEGERSKENTRDVKEEQGAPGVESAAEASPKSAAARFAKSAANPFTVGVKAPRANGRGATQKVKKGDEAVMTPGSAADDSEESPLNPQPTGQTPEQETEGAKAGKEDHREGDRGGTEHPANTENDELDGHKWAADADPIKMAADLKELGDQLCAQISWLAESTGNPKTAQDAARVASGGNSNGQAKQAAAVAPGALGSVELDPMVQMQLGWEMAGLITGTMDKQAADAMVQNAIEGIIKTASEDAENVVNYLDNFFAAAEQSVKQAAPGDDPAAPGGDGGAPGADGGQPPPGLGGGGGGPPPGMGPPGGGGGMNGEDLMGMLGGGVPAGGGGGPPPGGGDLGGGGGGDAETGALADLLDRLGVDEQDLVQAMAEEEGNGGGGGPPGGGGGPPPPPPGMEAQGADRGGRTQKQAVAKQGDYRAGMRQYITELIERSRRTAS